MSKKRRQGGAGLRRKVRAKRKKKANAFDNLGAELYLRPEGIVVDGETTDVTAWTNEGTAGAALDLSVAVNTPQKGTGCVVFDGTNYLETTGPATALNLADGDSIDLVVVCRGDLTGLRTVIGGAGGAHMRIGTRWGGGSQFYVFDDLAVNNLELGQNLTTGVIYASRARKAGAVSPGLDTFTLRQNDFEGTPSTKDLSSVTWATTLRLGIVTGSAFDGDVFLVAAKLGGFSVAELAKLTARINAITGFPGITSV